MSNRDLYRTPRTLLMPKTATNMTETQVLHWVKLATEGKLKTFLNGPRAGYLRALAGYGHGPS